MDYGHILLAIQLFMKDDYRLASLWGVFFVFANQIDNWRMKKQESMAHLYSADGYLDNIHYERPIATMHLQHRRN